MLRSNIERIKNIQSHIGVEADGILGPITLTELEKRLGLHQQFTSAKPSKDKVGLTLTASGLRHIINYEISSESHYTAKLQSPIWPGGDSGVTIGVGYDLGYARPVDFKRDWLGHLPISTLNRLSRECGKKRRSARLAVKRLSHIKVPYDAAYRVFSDVSISTYAQRTIQAFPGVSLLQPDAQVALLSLIYNRGSSMKGDRRREMRCIREAVKAQNYQLIAEQLISMKRLWAGKGLVGLLKRREHESKLVRNSQRTYSPDEIIRI